MKNKIYVGNLSYHADEDAVREQFSKYGEITDFKIIMDRHTGRSKGFGFITFAEEGQAQEAAENLNGQEMDGRPLRVNIARDDDRGGNRGGNRSGNFGGNRGGNHFGGSRSQGRGGNQYSGNRDGHYGGRSDF